MWEEWGAESLAATALRGAAAILRSMPRLSARSVLSLLLALAACRAPTPTLEENEDRMVWWREARFGLFLHWGLYAVPAGEWGDDDRHAEWILTTARIPLEQYEELVPRFDPVRFDADAWVRMAKEARMKYVVVTTKHHDGFALFDSRVSDYDVMATPFARDVMAELADACRRHGLRISWYHSIMDWHHADYLPRRDWEERSAEGADFDRYVAYLHAQVTELLTNYGDVGVMWFDGEWEATWNHERGRALYDLCRSLQPDVIVNNRVDVGRAGMEGFTEGGARAGDFGTPEQTVPDTGVPGVDWETCMTMNANWGYNAADRDWKPAGELVRKLVDIASKGGNFLLNVGPKADGTFPDEAVERLAAIGAWMDVNAEAIHGTEASPVERPEWGCVTTRRLQGGDTLLYLCVFDWPADGRLVLAGLGNELREARLLGAPERTVEVRRGSGELAFLLPGAAPDPHASVLAVRVAGAPVVYGRPRIEAAGETFLDTLEVTIEPPSDGIEVRVSLAPPGVEPGVARALDGARVVLARTTVVRAQSFHRGEPVSPTTERTFTRVEPLPALPVSPSAEPGAQVRVYRGAWSSLPDFATLEPASTDRCATIALPDGYREEDVARVYEARLDVPEEAMWVFALESDDGSRLLVDGELVVDNDGLHGPAEARGAVGLAAGSHDLRTEWFNRTGGAALGLRWARRGEELAPIPAERLRH